jgi:Ni,Fe-hydrogenase III large subunit
VSSDRSPARSRTSRRCVLANSTVRDRFTGTAVLSTEAASGVGALGYVARASGLDIDARRDHPFADLGASFTVVLEHGGDVLSRFLTSACASWPSPQRSSLDLRRRLGTGRPAPGTRTWRNPGRARGRARAGRGLAGNHRAPGRARTRTAGSSRVKVVDPSFFNWPALPLALADTIVPDFPLANKSFNQSYAGNDL